VKVGIGAAGTGILKEGNNFSLDPEYHNCLGPGKRTYHTIIPGFITRYNRPIGLFGVMGDFMQPQGHVQLIMNIADCNLNPYNMILQRRNTYGI